MAAQGVEAVAQHVHLRAQRAERLVELTHIGGEHIDARLTCQFAEVELARAAQMAGAAAFAVVGVAGDPFGVTRQGAAGGGVFDAGDAVQQVGQPARHRAGKADDFGQRIALGRRGVFAVGHDEMAEAFALAQRPGLVAIGGALEQQHVAIGAQRGFDRALPGGVGDFNGFAERAVCDAGLGEHGAEGAHFGVGGRAAAFVGMGERVFGGLEAGDQFALLRAQGGQLGFDRLVLGLDGDGVLAFFAGQQFAQRVALGQHAFEIAHAVVGAQMALLGGQEFAAGLGAGGFFTFAFGVDLCDALAGGQQTGLTFAAFAILGAQLAAFGTDVAAQFKGFEARNDFGVECRALVGNLLPFQIAIGFEALGLGLRAQAVEVDGQAVELALGVLLLFARDVVVVQHFLVAEDVEHQFEQRLWGVFAQLVGVALLQRQHLGDGRGQATGGEAALIVAQADPVVAGVERFDVDIVINNGVVARPFASGAADAAGEGDGVGQARKKRPAAGGAGQVGDGGANPRMAAVGAAHIAAEVALARAAQRKQRAQCVEQGGLARAVGADDGDDLGVQRQREAAPEVPVDQFDLFDMKHRSTSAQRRLRLQPPSCTRCW